MSGSGGDCANYRQVSGEVDQESCGRNARPKGDFALCCNNVDGETVSELGRAVECGIVTELGGCSLAFQEAFSKVLSGFTEISFSIA